MKKFLVLAMFIASVSVKAQTYNSSQGIIPIFMGDSVVFDLTQQPFYGLSLQLEKLESNGNYSIVYNIGDQMRTEASSHSDTWAIPYTNYNDITNFVIPTNYYSISINGKYSLSYTIPQDFKYKQYYYYYLNYEAINIYICPISSSNEIMGIFKVAEIPINVSRYPDYLYQPFQYWACSGQGNSGSNVSYYNHNGMMTAHRIQPTVDFTDLWYTEYDEVPRNPNWRQHYAFVEEIHHFAIGIGFGN
jgi:hypothetical protein